MDLLVGYDFEVQQIRGKDNLVADVLSRLEREQTEDGEVDEGDIVRTVWEEQKEYENPFLKVKWFLESDKL